MPHLNGDLGHDERIQWCLDCDRDTRHVLRVLPCSTEEATCQACLGEDDDDRHYFPRCPACGDPVDFCTGHGLIGDPDGARTLNDHDHDDHDGCHALADCKG